MGDFAVDVAVVYQICEDRGERSRLNAMDLLDDEFSLDTQAGGHSCDGIQAGTVKKGKPTSDENAYFVVIIMEKYFLL
jgi:hypothetical protein